MVFNIKYRPLKAFILAVETKSFTHAADRLGVTQPSFTALIQDLERTLDIKVFERTTRNIELTKAGIELYDRVNRPILDLEEAYKSIQDLATVSRGSVVVGVLPSVALTVIPPTLDYLRSKYSALQIRVIEAHNDDLISMLRTNQIEFAIATTLAEFADLEFTPLIEDVFCAVYPPNHPIAQNEKLNWPDLAEHNLILLSQGSSARSLFDRSLTTNENSKIQRYDVTHMMTAILLVKQGLGITLLPKLALSALPLEGLTHRPIEATSANRTIGVIRRKDRHMSPAERVFIEKLQKSLKSIQHTY